MVVLVYRHGVSLSRKGPSHQTQMRSARGPPKLGSIFENTLHCSARVGVQSTKIALGSVCSASVTIHSPCGKSPFLVSIRSCSSKWSVRAGVNRWCLTTPRTSFRAIHRTRLNMLLHFFIPNRRSNFSSRSSSGMRNVRLRSISSADWICSLSRGNSVLNQYFSNTPRTGRG